MPAKDSVFFIDTSFYLSFYLSREKNHKSARDIFDVVNAEIANPHYVTTDYVLIETVCTIWGHEDEPRYRRLRTAADVAKDIAEFTKIHHIQQNLFPGIHGLFQQRYSMGWSLVDCSSFIFIKDELRKKPPTKRKAMVHVLSFDKHFRAAQGEFGFEVFD